MVSRSGREYSERSPESRYAIQIDGVTKIYGATQALTGVDVAVAEGTIHAFAGENGAGKSTLLGIIAGRTRPTSGTIRLFGDEQEFGDPRAARSAGVVAIYQELTVLPNLTAVANVFTGEEASLGGFMDAKRMHAEYAEIAAELGVSIPPGAKARELSVADQQMLEIMRALRLKPRVILFDEPTSSLAGRERQALFAAMRRMRRTGITMILVSHNLDEVLDIADDITVFRDGAAVRTAAGSEWDKPSLIQAMLGADRLLTVQRTAPTPGTRECVLECENITVPGAVESVNVSVFAGEVLGVAGLVGSGRSTLMRALAGATPTARGRVRINGKWQRIFRSPRQGLRRGVALIPEERKKEGIIPSRSSWENMLLSDLSTPHMPGLFIPSRIRPQAAKVAEAVGLPHRMIDRRAGQLSGGNQQKLLIGRWQHRRPRVLLADEPTRGIDIGAKVEVLKLLRAMAADGVAVVVVSSDLEELQEVSDRIVVMAGGRMTGKFESTDGLTTEDILSSAFETEVIA